MEQVHEKHRRRMLVHGARWRMWSLRSRLRSLNFKAGEMAPQLRVCTAVTEDLSSVPHTHSEIQGD